MRDRYFKPRVEALEDRVLPSVDIPPPGEFVWRGTQSSDASVAANWLVVRPGADQVPGPNDRTVFDQNSPRCEVPALYQAFAGQVVTIGFANVLDIYGRLTIGPADAMTSIGQSTWDNGDIEFGLGGILSVQNTRFDWWGGNIG